MKSDKKECKIWLDKAKDDLLWTKANLKEKVYYGACFTAQQAIEKALKAYLVYRKGRFDKIHDLVKLIDECSALDKNFKDYRKIVSKISFYYIQTRYPDIAEVDIYSKSDAEEAYETAIELVEFVENKIIKI